MRKLSKKQGRIAKLAPPYDKITGADFKVLKKRKNKKMNKKKLQSISSELKKASKMHKAQAAKIDSIIKSIKVKKKK
jgi:hypothetical protein